MSAKNESETAADGAYQPKAVSRHDKIAKSKKSDLEARKEKLSNEKYALKKATKEKEEEIKKLPKDQQAEAKSKLKEENKKKKAALHDQRVQLVKEIDAEDDAKKLAKKNKKQ